MATNRVPMGKRLRFEIMKRDGFRCRYCGATPDQSLLHIDHVLPVVEGGTNDPVNLVTSCQPCNSGKAHKRLDEQIPPPKNVPSKKELKERREQVAAYLAAVKEAEAIRNSVAEVFAEMWESRIGLMSEGAMQRLRTLTETVDHKIIAEAIDVTSKRKVATPGQEFNSYQAQQQLRYFNAVVRNIREGREWRTW